MRSRKLQFVPRMAKPALLGFLLISAVFSTAQTLVERLYVMRTDTTVFDQMSGMSHTCLLLYPDGRYRMEKTFQGLVGGEIETRVYLDTLPGTDLKALEALLDDPKFEEIKTAPPRSGIVKDVETLSVAIPREHELQNINFENAAERKPYEKTLKPFLNTLKSIEKRKTPADKSEKPNNCEAPHVLYQTIMKQ